MSGTVQKIIHISLASACTYFWKTTAALKTSFWELCLSQNTRSQANMPSYLTWACKYSRGKTICTHIFFCPCKNPQMPEMLPEAPKIIFISLHSLLCHPKSYALGQNKLTFAENYWKLSGFTKDDWTGNPKINLSWLPQFHPCFSIMFLFMTNS